MTDQQLEQGLRQALDAGSPEPDELTRAALRAARYRALEKLAPKPWWASWWRPALALSLLVVSATLGWQLTAPEPESAMLAAVQSDDAAVIADLDLVDWLAEGEV